MLDQTLLKSGGNLRAQTKQFNRMIYISKSKYHTEKIRVSVVQIRPRAPLSPV